MTYAQAASALRRSPRSARNRDLRIQETRQCVGQKRRTRNAISHDSGAHRLPVRLPPTIIHAESDIVLPGRRADGLRDVGVDDEKGAEGTVAFEIWADGHKVASTGVLTNAMQAQPLSANVTGAQTVRLVVTDGGDGMDSDHADWANARLTC